MKIQKEAKRRRGFTLVELMVGSTLSAVIAGVVFTVYVSQQKNFIVGNSYINIHKDARMAMDWLAKDARWAIELLPTHGAYSTSNSCIILRIPSVDSAGDVIDVQNDHDFIIYKLDSSNPPKLERITDAKDGVSSRVDETRAIAENINSLVFSHNGTALSGVADLSTVGFLDIALVTGKTLADLSLSDNLNTTVKFRNKG